MENKLDKQQEFIQLRARGNSYDYIARELKVSKGTLIEWSRKLSIEIRNYSSIQMDALLDQHKISRTHQVEVFGTQLEKIREQIGKRDFSEVPTQNLISLELKILEFLNSHENTTTFTTSEMTLEPLEHSWNG